MWGVKSQLAQTVIAFSTSVELYLPLDKIWPAIFAVFLIANLTLEFKWC